MVLLRHLAYAVLVPALLAGCSQSLFDDGGDDDDASTPVAPDARAEIPDAGRVNAPDGGEPDAAGQSPDASLTRDICPKPCAGDAFGDFKTMQGGINERWRYVEVQPEQPDSPYVEMTSTVLPGPAFGWIGTGPEEPTIATCNSPLPGVCSEIARVLALTTPGNTAERHHPGLMWVAPEDGRYLLTGTWSVPSTAPAVATFMVFTRNSHSDVLYEEAPILVTMPHEFEVEIEVVANDRIVLTATASTEQSVSVGVDFFVTGPLGP